MNEQPVKKEGMFDKLYAKSKEALSAMKAPLEKRKLKRKFNSAYDQAIGKEQDALDKLNAEYEKLADMDISVLIQISRELNLAKEAQQIIKEQYEEVFGTALVIPAED